MDEELIPEQVMVAEFIEKFDASRDPELWLKLVEEELKEYEEAFEHFLKENADLAYVLAGLSLVGPEYQEEVYALLMNSLPFRYANEHQYGDNAQLKVFEEVHRSNMSKLGEDGKPIKREDGKILKGPNYQPANIRKVIEEVVNNAN